MLLDGHIGDCGQAARAYAAESGAVDLSTLREPYRIEGKKTLGLELAMQLGWTLPAAIIYPTGGGTGLIGMWKAFHELRDAGWVQGDAATHVHGAEQRLRARWSARSRPGRISASRGPIPGRWRAGSACPARSGAA